MEPFETFSAVAVPVDIPNCDTDQIIPARFLRNMPDDGGYERFLFHDLRFDDDGNERPEFILNQPAFRDAGIIVADVNWGCGSSRENAVDALVANGIRCVIAPSFGDIHFNNCMKHGVLPVRLADEVCEALRARLHAHPGTTLTVNLPLQQVSGPDGVVHAFEVAPFDKHRMLNGLDDIAVTLEYAGDIARFEEAQGARHDWL